MEAWKRRLWMVRKSPLTVIGGGIILLMLGLMIFAPWLVPKDLTLSIWLNACRLLGLVTGLARMKWAVIYSVGSLWVRSNPLPQVLPWLCLRKQWLTAWLPVRNDGRKSDAIIMRLMDIMLSIPSLVLTMALAAALGPSLFNAMLAIAIVRIPFYVRLARGQTLIVKQHTFVEASMTFGASRWHLISWHILRNALPPLVVQASLDIGSAILMAATLGFIGLGAQQPTAEWGAMVAIGRNYVLDQWWYCVSGAAILLTSVGFNLFGDGIQDLLDPKAGDATDERQNSDN
jgi:peptide/nickel transport system permease protein